MTHPSQLYSMISPLCADVFGPDQKANTGIMARNYGLEQEGMGSEGGSDWIFVLPFPSPVIS